MKNYIRYTFGLTLLVVLMMLGLRYLPAETLRSVGLKPVNILADLQQGNSVEQLDLLDAEYGAGETRGGYTVGSVVEPDTLASAAGDSTQAVSTIFVEPDPRLVEDSLAGNDTLAPQPVRREPVEPVSSGGRIPIRDYSPAGDMLSGFVAQLGRATQMQRPVRIGFMGDSFIEGDLLTSDFRELMQDKYGGGGVGFVPITSQVAGFRQTVGHKFGDWKQHSIVNSKEGGRFTISAFNFTPSEDSYVEYKASAGRPHLDRFSRARLLFISQGRSMIRVTINGEQEQLFETEPRETLQEIQLDGDFRSIRYQVSNVEGFTAYGVYLENPTGVCVDNFSVRGNAGPVMGRISPVLSEQFGELSPYDLIILQYGLNVVSSEVTDYSAYRKQMIQVVNHIRQCFPGVAILVMSVGDRATQENGQFVTMPGIRAMVAEQERVAQDCGVLFWNTYEAMRAAGGMGTFVKNGWAAKDYTHISARGGRKIATALFEAVTGEQK